MLAEVAPGEAAPIFTACVISAATPEEVAGFAAAAGPSAEIGAQINTIMARPDFATCLQAAAAADVRVIV